MMDEIQLMDNAYRLFALLKNMPTMVLVLPMSVVVQTEPLSKNATRMVPKSAVHAMTCFTLLAKLMKLVKLTCVHAITVF